MQRRDISGCSISSGKQTYTLSTLISDGNNSMVYKAHCLDQTNNAKKFFVIKEIFPRIISEDGQFLLIRDENNKIIPDPKAAEDDKASASKIFEEHKSLAKKENTAIGKLRSGRYSNDPFFFGKEDSFALNETIYTVFDTEEGEILKRAIEDDLNKFDGICQYVFWILEALKPVHERGILHLDIAPDNIHLSKLGVARLIDFGSCFDMATPQEKRTYTYKPGYSAFELKSREILPVDYATDLFSVVAIFFRMLKGKELELEQTEVEGYLDINNDNICCGELSAPTLEKINQIIVKGLNRELENRYASVEELRSDIDECLRINNNAAGFTRERFWNSSQKEFEIIKQRKRTGLIDKSIVGRLVPYKQNSEQISFKDIHEAFGQHANSHEAFGQHENSRKNFFIYSEEGGAGKTTQLLILWRELIAKYSKSDPIPIYVALDELYNEDSPIKDRPILNYICEKLGGIRDLEIDRKIQGLFDLFEDNGGRFLIMLDGLNEVSREVYSAVIKDVIELLKLNKISLIISSRDIPNDVIFDRNSFSFFKISSISRETIKIFLGNDVFENIENNERFLNVLNNPMLLNIYKLLTAEHPEITAYGESISELRGISSAGELLELYLKTHLYKTKNQLISEEKKEEVREIFDKILPKVGYAFYEQKKLSLSEKKLKKLLGIDGFKSFVEIAVTANLISISDRYEGKQYSMLQPIRDFLSAYKIRNEILDILEDDEIISPCALLNDNLLVNTVKLYLGELCKEHVATPFYNFQSKKWEAKNNGELFELLSKYKDKDKFSLNFKYEIANLIDSIALARNNDLSGLDVSNLDLSNVCLYQYRWSRYNGDSYLAGDFRGAKFSSRNWAQQNIHTITCACVISDTLVAAGLVNGVTQIWDISRNICVESRSLCDCKIKQLIFNSKLNKLFFFTGENKIGSCEIEIGSFAGNYFGEGEVEWLYESKYPVALIGFDKKNELNDLFFCTEMAPATRKYFSDDSATLKEKDDYPANVTLFNPDDDTWLRSPLLENRIIIKERDSDLIAVCNYKQDIINHDHYLQIVKSIKFNNEKKLFVTVTLNNEITVWNYDDKTQVATYSVPYANLQGAIFLNDNRILVYGDDFKTIDQNGEVETIFSLSNNHIINVILNCVLDNNQRQHHHLYVLTKDAIRMFRLSDFRCVNTITFDYNETVFYNAEMNIIQKTAQEESEAYDYIMITQKNKNKLSQAAYSIKSGTRLDTYEGFKLIWPEYSVKLKDDILDGCIVRKKPDSINFLNKQNRGIVKNFSPLCSLIVHGCRFSSIENDEQLVKILDENNVIWEE